MDTFWIDLGRRSYSEAFKIQETLHNRRVSGLVPDILIFQENDPTITIGRDTDEKNLLASREDYQQRGFDVVEVTRGGDVTYHGPGQLIVSAIVAFENYSSSAIIFVRLLEQVVIDTLEAFGIAGTRIKGLPGVWAAHPSTAKHAKIAAMGLYISHGITAHGMSINVMPNMAHFKEIIPCGLLDRGVIAMSDFQVTSNLAEVRNQYIKAFGHVFNRTVQSRTLQDLLVDWP